MHDEGGFYRHDSTCYTIALTLQLYLYVHGLDSTIYYGITKIDERIFGHAWVETNYINKKYIFNPGNVNLKKIKIIEEKSMSKEAFHYAFKH